ncbi:hypothetical protein SCP_0113920 [Sparassis crispa]|uniref:Small-subunit processome Utp12 domain-containing protein n=1 Tax=Sparassis crispa TaxID=139825 RepID=A0A401G8P0_9APHY|nr:hypothetical protein SCP_0113920 [Sparassis crispa]GBE78503.1 hypothetical protein SCP_0113920 [Sparassis crispa]
MALVPAKSKKPRTKPPRERPAATSTISQPAVTDSSSLTYLSTFSPLGNLFALLSLAVDKSQLRVYDTDTRQCVAEHLVDAGRVTSLCWGRFDPLETRKQAGEDDVDAQQPKRKRKKRKSLAPPAPPAPPAPQLVVLGLSDGALVLFSPIHGRVVRTLSHPASSAAILSVAVDETGSEHTSSIWTSSADGKFRLWDASQNTILSTWNSDDRNPYTALAVRPSIDEEGRTDVLVAHHSMRLLSTMTGSSESGKQKPKELAKFTGHASAVKDVQWCSSSLFLSLAEADRFICAWDVPECQASEGKMVASIPLDSDARCISLSPPSTSAMHQEQILLAVSASGKISVFPLPSELIEQSPVRTKQKVPTLVPKSIISVSTKSDTVEIVAAAFTGEEGRIRVAKLVNGIQPAFDVVTYVSEGGDYIKDVVISDANAGLASGPEGLLGASVRRYNESPSLAVRSGAELGQDEDMDDLPMRDVDGELDADLAELSLGQRLTALTGVEDTGSRSTSDEEDALTSTQKPKRVDAVQAVPANSLTRTLIQALHSSDAGLLETCLAHSDTTLIRNTVRRLPPQLAVPLITACVERLGRGARGGNMKGGGGGASSQRGTALINWVKAVLATHSGHLMTMPDLLARLSGLHATLTMRLALQDSLLALNGRLDMVVSQIEMRASGPPAPLPMPKGKGKETQGREARRYVEGESEAEDEDEQMDVEVESGDDGGSVEDIELGGSDEEEEEIQEDEDEDDEDDEEEDEEDEDKEDDLKLNGFIDDEAEEYSEEDDESE